MAMVMGSATFTCFSSLLGAILMFFALYLLRAARDNDRCADPADSHELFEVPALNTTR